MTSISLQSMILTNQTLLSHSLNWKEYLSLKSLLNVSFQKLSWLKIMSGKE